MPTVNLGNLTNYDLSLLANLIFITLFVYMIAKYASPKCKDEKEQIVHKSYTIGSVGLASFSAINLILAVADIKHQLFMVTPFVLNHMSNFIFFFILGFSLYFPTLVKSLGRPQIRAFLPQVFKLIRAS